MQAQHIGCARSIAGHAGEKDQVFPCLHAPLAQQLAVYRLDHLLRALDVLGQTGFYSPVQTKPALHLFIGRKSIYRRLRAILGDELRRKTRLRKSDYSGSLRIGGHPAGRLGNRIG